MPHDVVTLMIGPCDRNSQTRQANEIPPVTAPTAATTNDRIWNEDTAITRPRYAGSRTSGTGLAHARVCARAACAVVCSERRRSDGEETRRLPFWVAPSTAIGVPRPALEPLEQLGAR